MEQRSAIVNELESLLAQFKNGLYTDYNVAQQMLQTCQQLTLSFSSNSMGFQFGSEFTPTKDVPARFKRGRPNPVSDSDESSSLSDSESEDSSAEEAKPIAKKKKPIAKKSVFGGDGGSEESDSGSSSDSEEEVKRMPKKALRKKKDPNAPKRPMSAYMLFSMEKRGPYREAHPDASMMDIARALGVMWKDSSDAEKKIYQDKALQEKLRYEEEMRQYNAKNAETAGSTPFLGESPLKVAKKEEKEPAKRPASAFMLFVREKREETKAKHPELSFGDLTKQLAVMWKELSEEDKKAWTDKAAM